MSDRLPLPASGPLGAVTTASLSSHGRLESEAFKASGQQCKVAEGLRSSISVTRREGIVGDAIGPVGAPFLWHHMFDLEIGWERHVLVAH